MPVEEEHAYSHKKFIKNDKTTNRRRKPALPTAHAHGVIEALRSVLTEPDGFDKALQSQKKAALLETAEAFLTI